MSEQKVPRSVEQRIVIKFLVGENVPSAEIHHRLTPTTVWGRVSPLWLHSLKVAQLLRSGACLHTNQSRSYLNHLVYCTKNVFWSSLQLLSESFPILRRINRSTVINVHSASCKIPENLVRFWWKLNFLDVFSKNIKFHENPSIGRRFLSSMQTDRPTWWI